MCLLIPEPSHQNFRIKKPYHENLGTRISRSKILMVRFDVKNFGKNPNNYFLTQEYRVASKITPCRRQGVILEATVAGFFLEATLYWIDFFAFECGMLIITYHSLYDNIQSYVLYRPQLIRPGSYFFSAPQILLFSPFFSIFSPILTVFSPNRVLFSEILTGSY